MSRGAERPPRFRLTFHRDISDDLRTLDPEVFDAIQGTLADLAHGRITGKELGERRVSADLHGLARVKFDIAGRHPQRFRVVYRHRQVDNTTRDVLVIAARDEHAVYRAAAARLIETEQQEKSQ